MERKSKYDLEQELLRTAAERDELAAKLKKLEVDSAMTEAEKTVKSLVGNLSWNDFTLEERNFMSELFEYALEKEPKNILFLKKLDERLAKAWKAKKDSEEKANDLQRQLDEDKHSSRWARRMPPFPFYTY